MRMFQYLNIFITHLQACPEREVEDCSANIVDSAGNALVVPVNFVEEGLSYDRG